MSKIKRLNYRILGELLVRMGFSSYKEYLYSDIWKAKRAFYIATSKHIKWLIEKHGQIVCETCHQPGFLQLHHKKYERLGAEDVKRDLVLVCGPCHKERHEIDLKRKRSKKAFVKRGCKTCMKEEKEKPKIQEVQVGKGEVREVNEVNALIDLFRYVNPAWERLFPNKTQRAAIERLLKVCGGREKLEATISVLPKTNNLPYFPVITNPLELEKNLGKLIARYNQYQQINGKNKFGSF